MPKGIGCMSAVSTKCEVVTVSYLAILPSIANDSFVAGSSRRATSAPWTQDTLKFLRAVIKSSEKPDIPLEGV